MAGDESSCWLQIVVFNETGNEVFHGHVHSWEGLRPETQNALTRAGLVNKCGQIIKYYNNL